LIGPDPQHLELDVTREKLAAKVYAWGGVNGYLAVEQGTADMVRSEVRRVLQLFGPVGGFILSPVDNVRQDIPKSIENARVLIDEWQKSTC
jgi:hypothetical protein